MLLVTLPAALPQEVAAQVVAGQIDISARVPDHVDPSTPVLIAPENNSLLNTATPTFIWQESTDNVGVSSYSLSLNGSVLFSDIPTTPTSNAQFILSYNSGSGYFSLLPENLLANGTHTWKITAFDADGNYTDSVTWTFTIDTRAPNFVINEIGEKNVSISAHDLDTIPDDPIELTENEPLITGTGEVGSTVLVTITTPDETEQATFQIGNDGTWQLQLGILPRGKVVYLDFVIEDQAGNISILENVAIMIIDPTAATPTPVATPIPPGQTPAPTPPLIIPPGGSPPPDIVDLSPREWRHRVLKLAEPLLPLSLKEIAKLELIRPPGSEPWYYTLLNLAAPALLLIPPLVSFGLFLYIFGNFLPLSSIPQLAALTGLIPRGRRLTGMVFDSQTGKGVAFARVVYTGIDANGSDITAQAVSNHRGFFAPPDLPEGEYLAAVDYPTGEFPTAEPRLKHLQYRDFYKGEKIALGGYNSEHQLLIPIDLSTEKPPLSYQLAGTFRTGSGTSWMSFVIASLITILFPSGVNLGVQGAAAVLWLSGRIKKQLRQRGRLIDTNRRAVERAILRFYDEKTGSTLLLTVSDKNGLYTLPPTNSQKLALSLVKLGAKVSDADDLSTVIVSQS